MNAISGLNQSYTGEGYKMIISHYFAFYMLEKSLPIKHLKISSQLYLTSMIHFVVGQA